MAGQDLERVLRFKDEFSAVKDKFIQALKDSGKYSEKELKTISKSFDDAGKSSSQFSKTMDKSAADSKKAVDKLSNSFKDLKGSFDKIAAFSQKAFFPIELFNKAAAAIGSVINASEELVNKYAVQAKAEQSLEQAMKSRGDFTTQQFEQLKQYASELQGKSIFGDEGTLQILSSLTSAGMDYAKATDLVSVASDVASAKGRDLADTTKLIQQAQFGEIGELKTLLDLQTQNSIALIKSDKNLTDAEKNAKSYELVLNSLSKAYAGQSEITRQADGGMQALSNTWGDFQEKLGEIILPAMSKATGFLDDILTTLMDAEGTDLGFIDAIGDAFNAVFDSIISIWEMLKNLGGILKEAGIEEAARSVFDVLGNVITLGTSAIDAVMDFIGGIKQLFGETEEGGETVISVFGVIFDTISFVNRHISNMIDTIKMAFNFLSGDVEGVEENIRNINLRNNEQLQQYEKINSWLKQNNVAINLSVKQMDDLVKAGFNNEKSIENQNKLLVNQLTIQKEQMLMQAATRAAAIKGVADITPFLRELRNGQAAAQRWADDHIRGQTDEVHNVIKLYQAGLDLAQKIKELDTGTVGATARQVQGTPAGGGVQPTPEQQADTTKQQITIIQNMLKLGKEAENELHKLKIDNIADEEERRLAQIEYEKQKMLDRQEAEKQAVNDLINQFLELKAGGGLTETLIAEFKKLGIENITSYKSGEGKSIEQIGNTIRAQLEETHQYEQAMFRDNHANENKILDVQKDQFELLGEQLQLLDQEQAAVDELAAAQKEYEDAEIERLDKINAKRQHTKDLLEQTRQAEEERGNERISNLEDEIELLNEIQEFENRKIDYLKELEYAESIKAAGDNAEKVREIENQRYLDNEKKTLIELGFKEEAIEDILKRQLALRQESVKVIEDTVVEVKHEEKAETKAEPPFKWEDFIKVDTDKFEDVLAPMVKAIGEGLFSDLGNMAKKAIDGDNVQLEDAGDMIAGMLNTGLAAGMKALLPGFGGMIAGFLGPIIEGVFGAIFKTVDHELERLKQQLENTKVHVQKIEGYWNAISGYINESASVYAASLDTDKEKLDLTNRLIKMHKEMFNITENQGELIQNIARDEIRLSEIQGELEKDLGEKSKLRYEIEKTALESQINSEKSVLELVKQREQYESDIIDDKLRQLELNADLYGETEANLFEQIETSAKNLKKYIKDMADSETIDAAKLELKNLLTEGLAEGVISPEQVDAMLSDFEDVEKIMADKIKSQRKKTTAAQQEALIFSGLEQASGQGPVAFAKALESLYSQYPDIMERVFEKFGGSEKFMTNFYENVALLKQTAITETDNLNNILSKKMDFSFFDDLRESLTDESLLGSINRIQDSMERATSYVESLTDEQLMAIELTADQLEAIKGLDEAQELDYRRQVAMQNEVLPEINKLIGDQPSLIQKALLQNGKLTAEEYSQLGILGQLLQYYEGQPALQSKIQEILEQMVGLDTQRRDLAIDQTSEIEKQNQELSTQDNILEQLIRQRERLKITQSTGQDVSAQLALNKSEIADRLLYLGKSPEYIQNVLDKLPRLATGGIADRLSFAGESGAEAVFSPKSTQAMSDIFGRERLSQMMSNAGSVYDYAGDSVLNLGGITVNGSQSPNQTATAIKDIIEKEVFKIFRKNGKKI